MIVSAVLSKVLAVASEWVGMKLGDFVTLVRGTTYRSAQLGQPGPVLLGLASIRPEGGFRGDNLKTYGGDTSSKLRLTAGDMYVSLKDVTQAGKLLGAVARVPRWLSEGRLTQDTVKLVLAPCSPSADYVYWLLRTPEFRTYFKERATGTTNLALARSDFLAVDVPEPTEERLRICELLTLLDEKIEVNRRMATTLEDMAHALYKNWFVDFDLVRAKQAGHAAALPTATAALFPDRFGEDGLPKGWAATADSVGLNVRQQVLPSDVDPETPYVGLEHIERRRLVLETVGRAEDVDSQKAMFKRGDLLFGKLRPYFHKVAIAPTDGICSTDILVFRPQAGVPPSYLYLAFSEDGFVTKASGAQEGTRMPRADWGYMRRQPMALPTPPVLAEFDAVVSPLLDRMRAAIEQVATLTAIRNSLLPKLISGELGIKEADKVVEVA